MLPSLFSRAAPHAAPPPLPLAARPRGWVTPRPRVVMGRRVGPVACRAATCRCRCSCAP
ncbi:hypothetical protein BU14_0022s0054 [Porphyra umbilicalis]|uniref:Uncharacterized protein n=1 Tax=Porphyra umbilicalis TaxID=2786 RepID=A0A1X6PK97_PORUM|nr:hypothetical protein BU14_0022s0054 [Porphyra umbilicalis]|eukprot:OSX81334.1 hypothetical protein BU14_0022s0054 [Porphyra umbilicalis]